MDFDEVLADHDVQEEEEVTDRCIKDIRDHLASEKRSTAQGGLNHCSHFLKSHCAKEKIRYMRLEEIPFKGIDGKGNLFWNKMISSFMHWCLGSAAVRGF